MSHHHKKDLSCFFEPQAIAIIGSFREGFFGGHVIIKSLMGAGYKGRIYPVNPAYRKARGLKVYASIKDVPEHVDFAMILINARSVAKVVEECAEKGVRAIVVVSDGFAERDREGARLQDELVKIARARGVRIIGPNTAGVVNTSNGFNPCPYEAGYYKLREGPVAICAQTGMINPQAFPYPVLGFGVSKICDFGNKCDLNECDMLEYLENDPHTHVISMYLESIHDGQSFLKISKRVTPQKPFLVVKSGATKEGAMATFSHTGAMAIDDKVFQAVCNQAGILRLDNFEELFKMPKIFASQSLPSGNQVGIMSFTGGIAALAIDEAARHRLRLAEFTLETAGMLEDIFPGLGRMPVDMGPMMAALKDAFDQYPRILEIVLGDPNIHALFSVLWASPKREILGRYIEAYELVKERFDKPVATWIYGPDPQLIAELRSQIEEMGFPVFEEPETCIKAIGLAVKYTRIREKR